MTSIPEGYPQVIPYLTVDNGAAAIDFYVKIFDATERVRMLAPDGLVAHAELEIGESLIMLAEAIDAMGTRTPTSLGGTPVTLMIYVPDADATVAAAVAAGATLERAVADQFYGDRAGGIIDPFGHRWHIATHIESISNDDLQSRFDAMPRG